jgi:hypothetical protein
MLLRTDCYLVTAVTRIRNESRIRGSGRYSTDELVSGYFQKQTPWPLGVPRGQRGGSLTAVILSFVDRSRYFSFK